VGLLGLAAREQLRALLDSGEVTFKATDVDRYGLLRSRSFRVQTYQSGREFLAALPDLIVASQDGGDLAGKLAGAFKGARLRARDGSDTRYGASHKCILLLPSGTGNTYIEPERGGKGTRL
jgi:hypothetical protein